MTLSHTGQFESCGGLRRTSARRTAPRHGDHHGIGHELAEDLPEERRKKGERIEWSVSLTPLRELLSLPVRVKREVRIKYVALSRCSPVF
jgi:hypothetical protein